MPAISPFHRRSASVRVVSRSSSGRLVATVGPYAPYGPGVAFLILPFHLIGRTVAAVAGVPRAPFPEGIAWEFLVGGITTLAMAFAAALTVAGFFRAALALGGSKQTARQLALILGAVDDAVAIWNDTVFRGVADRGVRLGGVGLARRATGRSIRASTHPHRVGAACGGGAHQANRARHRSGFHRRGPLRYARRTVARGGVRR